MLSADDDLLFSDALKNITCNQAEILFDASADDKVLVDVTYFYLRAPKVLSQETIIEPREPLIAVGYSEETGKVNVYRAYSDTHIYFWVNIEEIDKHANVMEWWTVNEVRVRNSAIKENWVKIKK